MRNFKHFLAIMLLSLPLFAIGFDGDDLPGNSTWYFHADFKEMRSSEGGNGLWLWLEDEVLDDVRDDAGIDLSTEADTITAYATRESGVVFVLEGNISQETKDKALVAAASAERFDTLKHKGKTYYYVQRDGDAGSDKIEIDGIDNQAYFSFALKNKLIAASNEEQLHELLENGGRIAGSRGHQGALIVLTAEKSLIQAGLDADEMDAGDEEGGFKSNILRNTRHAALLIADVAGKIAIEAQLVTEEPEMAESLASIVRGLIALGSFSDDVEPEIAEFLRNTKVKVDGTSLKVSVTLAPEAIIAALEEA